MWKINIKAPFGGYLNKYYLDDNLTVGENNKANDMKCIDINNINSITPGFTNQKEETTSEVVFKFSNPDSQGYIYGISNTKVIRVASSMVSTAYFPHTISGAAPAGFWNNIVVYGNELYYFWHTFTGGDIGKAINITGSTPVFDDDWGSTENDNLEDGYYTPTYITADNILLFGNSQYLGWYDGTTLDTKFYDFGDRLRIKAITEQSGIIYVAVVDTSSDLGYIYAINDDISTEATIIDMINVGDEVTELYAINGIIYVFHKEIIGEKAHKIGYISGNRIIDLGIQAKTMGNQVLFANDMLFFSGEGEVLAMSTPYESSTFELTSPFDVTPGILYGYGALGNTGSELIYSTSTNTAGEYYIQHYDLKDKGIDSYWVSKTWIVGDIDSLSVIDSIVVKTNALKSTAKCNLEIYKNKETTPIKTLAITTKDKTRHIFRNLGVSGVDEFKIKLDFSVGVVNKKVEIQSIEINGHPYEI